MIKQCFQCPRHCKVDRDKEKGFCGALNDAKIAKVMLHHWEEPIISGSEIDSGSGAIFFSHCNLKCVYCQNYKISHNDVGEVYSPQDLADLFKKLEQTGALNINLVTPTHYSKSILKALKIYKPKIPVVYNCGGYEDEKMLEELKDYIDIYLTDLKYFSSDLSKKYSFCPDYFEKATKAILKMRENVKNDVIENRLMKKGLIIRHMVLPNQTDDSLKVLDWIKTNLGTKTYISLMSQYTPFGEAKNYPEINRSLKPLEYKRVYNYLLKLGFYNGFMQEMSSSNNCYIPDFDKNEKENFMKSKVYYTKNITPESLIKIYEALNINLDGKVGVKVSTGEDGSRGYLKKELIAPLVQKLNATIVECNTAYAGMRTNKQDHMRVVEKHGFTSFANVDIMDGDGEFKIPVNCGKHLKYDIVGENLKNYDSILNLAHGKGHMMGGFGGNLKNQSIGIASRNGKAYIHSCGKTIDPDKAWTVQYEQKDFIESMAEAAGAVCDYMKENNKKIAYITVMNFLSVDCDCDANQTDPVMEDLGIVASLDPVANDQAFIDLVWNSQDKGAKLLQQRIDRQQGRHILPYAQSLKIGSTEYELIDIDK